MTNGTSNTIKRCDLCGKILKDGAKDIHELNKPYELPYQIEWNGTECSITNKVVRHICNDCLTKVMETVKGLMM